MPEQTIGGKTKFQLRSKIWIEDRNGALAFGLGRYRILEAIGRLGSMQAAAKELKMSYRAVWCRLNASGERLGYPLVERKGRGSQLTPYAVILMKQYKRLQAIVEAESDEVYQSGHSGEGRSQLQTFEFRIPLA